MKTLTPSPKDIRQDWYVVDATGLALGRLSTQVASILRGKNKPYFAPNLDTGGLCDRDQRRKGACDRSQSPAEDL